MSRSPAQAKPASETDAPRDAWLQLENQLCFAIYAASLAMTRRYQPLLEPLGLTYPQYLALLAMWEQDGLTVGELGARLDLDSGTLTPLLKRLETAGLLVRDRDRDDERRVLLHLSASGRALRRRAAPVPRALAAATGCSARQLADLTRQLHALRARLASSDADAG